MRHIQFFLFFFLASLCQTTFPEQPQGWGYVYSFFSPAAWVDYFSSIAGEGIARGAVGGDGKNKNLTELVEQQLRPLIVNDLHAEIATMKSDMGRGLGVFPKQCAVAGVGSFLMYLGIKKIDALCKKEARRAKRQLAGEDSLGEPQETLGATSKKVAKKKHQFKKYISPTLLIIAGAGLVVASDKIAKAVS